MTGHNCNECPPQIRNICDAYVPDGEWKHMAGKEPCIEPGVCAPVVLTGAREQENRIHVRDRK
jgi:hypothetical protein